MRRQAILGLVSFLFGGCAMSGPAASDAASVGGKADEFGQPVIPILAPAYTLSVSSHVTDGRRSYDSAVRGYIEPVETEEGLILALYPCEIDLPEVSDRQPRLDPEMVAQLAPVTLPATFREDADGQLTLATETGALALGVTLDDPLSDALPTSKRDERLFDQDDDDEPGVTLWVGGFQLYGAARARLWLAGTIDAETGGFHGDVDLDVDFEIYDDNIPFYDAGEELEEARAEAADSALEVDNSFALEPLDAVPSSCAALTR